MEEVRHVILSSEFSKDIFPENTPNGFYNLLPERLDLTKESYYISLEVIQLIATVPTLPKDTFFKVIKSNDTSTTCTPFTNRSVPDDASELINALNEALPTNLKSKVTFGFNTYTFKASVTLQRNFRVELSDSIKKVLGMQSVDIRSTSMTIIRSIFMAVFEQFTSRAI